MKWECAKIHLREGRKIRRPNWQEESYWVLSKDGNERIICQNGDNARIHLQQIETNDWEIFEEKSPVEECIKNLGWEIASKTEKALKYLDKLGIDKNKCFLDGNNNLIIPIRELAC